MSGENFTCWRQDHPNKYRYETPPGSITGGSMYIPVLAHLEESEHFVLMGQITNDPESQKEILIIETIGGLFPLKY